MLQYYIPYDEKADISYIYLLTFYSIAEYNSITGLYDTIPYKSFEQLEERTAKIHRISAATIYRTLKNKKYRKYLYLDQKKKLIRINNNIKECNKFVVLSQREVDFIISNRDNLLAKYLIYRKYYCLHTRRKKSDTTAKQFLAAIGLSTKSNSYISKISEYNRLLVDNKFLTLEKYRDENGNERNLYGLA